MLRGLAWAPVAVVSVFPLVAWRLCRAFIETERRRAEFGGLAAVAGRLALSRSGTAVSDAIGKFGRGGT